MAKLPQKPRVEDPILQNWINDVHKHISAQPPPATTPPGQPTGIKVINGPGQILVRFTAGQNAERHLILASPNPVWNPSVQGNAIHDIGQSTEFTHSIGQPNLSYYYWVVAVRGTFRANPVGPAKGVTLALGTPATPPASTTAQPGQLVESASTQLPTIPLPGLTRGGRQP